MIDIQYFLHNALYKHRTPLCNIMDECGSDKAGRINGRHNYTTFYDYAFKSNKDTVQNVFEIGLGTTNTSIPSSMGSQGVPCGSLRGWKRYFSHANIYGADIDREILYQEEKINTYFCDQTDKNSIQELWNKFDFECDIIIDDGLHTIEGNSTFFYNSIDSLRDEGIYIIEDIYLIDTYADFIEDIKHKYKQVEFLRIPNIYNDCDNNLIIVVK